MNTPHIELETITAYLDGDLAPRERNRIAGHLDSCASCAASAHRMERAARSVAGLGPVEMTIDEHRALRQAVLAGAKPAGRWWSLGRLQWSVAGAFALIAVAVVGFSFLRSVPRQADEVESATEAAAPADESLMIESDAQIRDTVLALPEVQERFRRSVAGPEPLQAPAMPPGELDRSAEGGVAVKAQPAGEPETLGRTEGGGGGSAGGLGGDAAGGGPGGSGEFAGATNQEAEAGAALPEETGLDCLSALAATQSQPLTPITSEPVVYRGTPAWLLVYDAPLPDHSTEIRSYVVGREDCARLSGGQLDDAVLARSAFKP
jgi:hypothetical protein